MRAGNENQVSPVDIRPFPKAGVRTQTRQRKSRVRAILADTPGKAAFGTGSTGTP